MKTRINDRDYEVIRNRDGKVINMSRNLAGIHRYVSNHIIDRLAIARLANGEGRLTILFQDESSFETTFADFYVLRNHIRNWRNVYGAPLFVNGEAKGKVGSRNFALTWVCGIGENK